MIYSMSDSSPSHDIITSRGAIPYVTLSANLSWTISSLLFLYNATNLLHYCKKLYMNLLLYSHKTYIKLLLFNLKYVKISYMLKI
jgi:hypothetical protein